MARARVVPDGASTVHFVGDLHMGGYPAVRTDKALADLRHPTVPRPAACVQVGDQTEAGTGVQDTAALAWLRQLPAGCYTTVGNHDVWQNGRTVAAWQAVYGAGKNYTVDVGFVKLVVVGMDTLAYYPSNTTKVELAAATLSYLDAELQAATKDCWVVCHAPLANTVVGDTGLVYSSAEPDFAVQQNDTTLRAILANRPRAKAWFSGHTHSPVDAPGFVKAETVGQRTVAAVNCSALAFTGRSAEWNDPLITLWATRLDTGQIEIRYRDHGAGCWTAVNGQRVTTVTPT